jgi:vacuolar protein sorting-associated protein 13A/C
VLVYWFFFFQYLKDSIDGIINFFESSKAVSQTIALETAAAVQVPSI